MMSEVHEGEGGSWPNSDLGKGGCVDLVLTRGREWVQNSKIYRRHMCMSPKGPLTNDVSREGEGGG